MSFQYSFCAHFIWSTHHQHIYFNFIWNNVYRWLESTVSILAFSYLITFHIKFSRSRGGFGRVFDLHLRTFATRYVLLFYIFYSFAHFSEESTHQHLHVSYMHFDLYEIHAHLAGFVYTVSSKPFYSWAHFIWNSILSSQCLISISQFALTQQ